jgi:hypothetical protein
MRVLRALFNFAAANYEAGGKALVLDNPVKRLSRTRAWFRVDRRETLIKPHQLRPWMEAVLALDNGLARDYLQLVLLTGLRRISWPLADGWGLSAVGPWSNSLPRSSAALNSSHVSPRLPIAERHEHKAFGHWPRLLVFDDPTHTAAPIAAFAVALWARASLLVSFGGFVSRSLPLNIESLP